MAGSRKRTVFPRRRRRDDDGEDDTSTAGDIGAISSSEGSSAGHDDGDHVAEGSEASTVEDETITAARTELQPEARPSNSPDHVHSTNLDSSATARIFRMTSVKDNVTNGLDKTDEAVREEVKIDQSLAHPIVGHPTRSEDAASSPLPSKSYVQRGRRDHAEYVRQRDADPAFVPNRGGFFMHDTRDPQSGGPYNRPYGRGRGRGYGTGFGPGRGYNHSVNQPADRQWSHDLHDTVNNAFPSSPARVTPSASQIPTARPAPSAPNRTFSVITVIGKVPIQVFLPGHEHMKSTKAVTKKQYTLLPQHRPPLRRDKPVRISIPDDQPRYIFPSTERSFIFIPRALRPNQQGFNRGRGRGSFHGSRRGSILGSTNTPSVGMSRKSSISMIYPGTGYHTPTEPSGQHVSFLPPAARPIVKMPGSSTGMPPPIMTTPTQGAPGPAILHSPPINVPMQHPRPRKTLSVAEIESPVSNANGPHQAERQPFHQQMPPSIGSANSQSQPQAMATPLSHIPEGAVSAAPFQPYAMYQHQQPMYYGVPYGTAQSFYPPNVDSMGYAVMGGPVMAPHLSQQSMAGTNAGPSGPVPHEQNGMVFYYEQPQQHFQMDGSHMTQYHYTHPGMMAMAPPPQYMYPAPNVMFYPTPPTT